MSATEPHVVGRERDTAQHAGWRSAVGVAGNVEVLKGRVGSPERKALGAIGAPPRRRRFMLTRERMRFVFILRKLRRGNGASHTRRLENNRGCTPRAQTANEHGWRRYFAPGDANPMPSGRTAWLVAEARERLRKGRERSTVHKPPGLTHAVLDLHAPAHAIRRRLEQLEAERGVERAARVDLGRPAAQSKTIREWTS